MLFNGKPLSTEKLVLWLLPELSFLTEFTDLSRKFDLWSFNFPLVKFSPLLMITISLKFTAFVILDFEVTHIVFSLSFP